MSFDQKTSLQSFDSVDPTAGAELGHSYSVVKSPTFLQRVATSLGKTFEIETAQAKLAHDVDLNSDELSRIINALTTAIQQLEHCKTTDPDVAKLLLNKIQTTLDQLASSIASLPAKTIQTATLSSLLGELHAEADAKMLQDHALLKWCGDDTKMTLGQLVTDLKASIDSVTKVVQEKFNSTLPGAVTHYREELNSGLWYVTAITNKLAAAIPTDSKAIQAQLKELHQYLNYAERELKDFGNTFDAFSVSDVFDAHYKKPVTNADSKQADATLEHSPERLSVIKLSRSVEPEMTLPRLLSHLRQQIQQYEQQHIPSLDGASFAAELERSFNDIERDYDLISHFSSKYLTIQQEHKDPAKHKEALLALAKSSGNAYLRAWNRVLANSTELEATMMRLADQLPQQQKQHFSSLLKYNLHADCFPSPVLNCVEQFNTVKAGIAIFRENFLPALKKAVNTVTKSANLLMVPRVGSFSHPTQTAGANVNQRSISPDVELQGLGNKAG